MALAAGRHGVIDVTAQASRDGRPGLHDLAQENGKLVKTLKAGKYTFVDLRQGVDPQLPVEGPGVDRAITSVPFKGTKTVTIMLRQGK